MSRQTSRGRDRARPAPPPPSPRDWRVIAVAAAGVLVAGYLGVTKLLGGAAAFCATGGGCDIVQASRYAMLLGVPTALWGVAAYAAVGTLAMLGLTTGRWLMAFAIAAGAVGFSAYLTWLELFVIRALCGYCLVSAALAVAVLAVLLVSRPVIGGRRSPVRPARLVTLGGASAVATIVVGAAIFAATPDSGNVGYQEALARHLAATGAVMYGAYW
jgi:uncharacterized membrane protein